MDTLFIVRAAVGTLFQSPARGPAPGPDRRRSGVAASGACRRSRRRGAPCSRRRRSTSCERAVAPAPCNQPRARRSARRQLAAAHLARGARWRDEIQSGRGFSGGHGRAGARVEDEVDASICFWCLGLHMGRPGAQNPQGDLLGHVRDAGADARDAFVRLYRTAANPAYHCDAADVVGLLCLQAAQARRREPDRQLGGRLRRALAPAHRPGRAALPARTCSTSVTRMRRARCAICRSRRAASRPASF